MLPSSCGEGKAEFCLWGKQQLMHLHTDQTGSREGGSVRCIRSQQPSLITQQHLLITQQHSLITWMKPCAGHTDPQRALCTYITHQTLKHHQLCFQPLNLLIQLLLESFCFLCLLQGKTPRRSEGRTLQSSSLSLSRKKGARMELNSIVKFNCYPPW